MGRSSCGPSASVRGNHHQVSEIDADILVPLWRKKCPHGGPLGISHDLGQATYLAAQLFRSQAEGADVDVALKRADFVLRRVVAPYLRALQACVDEASEFNCVLFLNIDTSIDDIKERTKAARLGPEQYAIREAAMEPHCRQSHLVAAALEHMLSKLCQAFPALEIRVHRSFLQADQNVLLCVEGLACRSQRIHLAVANDGDLFHSAGGYGDVTIGLAPMIAPSGLLECVFHQPDEVAQAQGISAHAWPLASAMEGDDGSLGIEGIGAKKAIALLQELPDQFVPLEPANWIAALRWLHSNSADAGNLTEEHMCHIIEGAHNLLPRLPMAFDGLESGERLELATRVLQGECGWQSGRHGNAVACEFDHHFLELLRIVRERSVEHAANIRVSTVIDEVEGSVSTRRLALCELRGAGATVIHARELLSKVLNGNFQSNELLFPKVFSQSIIEFTATAYGEDFNGLAVTVTATPIRGGTFALSFRLNDAGVSKGSMESVNGIVGRSDVDEIVSKMELLTIGTEMMQIAADFREQSTGGLPDTGAVELVLAGTFSRIGHLLSSGDILIECWFDGRTPTQNQEGSSQLSGQLFSTQVFCLEIRSSHSGRIALFADRIIH
jgi:hypothetical protein